MVKNGSGLCTTKRAWGVSEKENSAQRNSNTIERDGVVRTSKRSRETSGENVGGEGDGEMKEQAKTEGYGKGRCSDKNICGDDTCDIPTCSLAVMFGVHGTRCW